MDYSIWNTLLNNMFADYHWESCCWLWMPQKFFVYWLTTIMKIFWCAESIFLFGQRKLFASHCFYLVLNAFYHHIHLIFENANLGHPFCTFCFLNTHLFCVMLNVCVFYFNFLLWFSPTTQRRGGGENKEGSKRRGPHLINFSCTLYRNVDLSFHC